MSHGPPQPPPAVIFAFGSITLGTDASGMLPLLDGPMYSNFDGLAMDLDGVDNPAMPQPFSAIPPALPPGSPPALIPTVAATGQKMNARDMPVNVLGAGPLPTTNIGAPSSGASGGSALTEFTKRKNWSAKVVEELSDILQILDANGRVKYVSPSLRDLTGYDPSEVLERFLQDFIHPDDLGVFTAELHESTASGTPLRVFYRMKKKDGSWSVFEAAGHAHIAAAKFAPNPNNQSPFCQALFMMVRPYPTKNAALLDSFLEHKIENERLKRRIAELRREEADETDDSPRTRRQSRDGFSETTVSDDARRTGMGPPPLHRQNSVSSRGTDGSASLSSRLPSVNSALTRENLEEIAGSRQVSVGEKMARYEGTTHADTIEMLTGLRYSEGERSRGLTTGNTSPALIRGDAGIAIPVDRDPRTGEKKKKIKVAEEYVCTDCGTLDSPEWRKGPSGPKTLCNACGLRWAKKEKKKNSGSLGGSGGGSAGPAASMLDSAT